MNLIDKWKKIFFSQNYEELESIISENTIFYSPVVFKEKKGKEQVFLYLSSAIKVFSKSNFSYINEATSNNYVYAEFQCELDTIRINGIDYIKHNSNYIEVFKVFLRPYKAIEVVKKEMEKILWKILKI